MRLEDLVMFFELHGVGEYRISILPCGECVIVPLTDGHILADIEVIMEMVAERDARRLGIDL